MAGRKTSRTTGSRQVVIRRSKIVCDRLRLLIPAIGILNIFGDLFSTDFDRETVHGR